MSSSKVFVAGDLVLVKFPVFGYWPSKITSQKVPTADYEAGWRKIKCFGDIKGMKAYDENIKDMKVYDDNNNMKFISKKSVKKYPALTKGLKQISKEYQKINNGTKEKKNQSKAKNSIKPKHNEVMEEEKAVENLDKAEEPNNAQEGTNKNPIEESDEDNSEPGCDFVEEEENSLNNLEKAKESNMQASSEEPINVDGEFNFEIKVENEIRNEESSTIQPNCTSGQGSCGGRNTDENDKISMTIQMSEATFVRIAALLPDTIQVQYQVNASSNIPQQ